MTKRARTERRKAERAAVKLAGSRTKLAALEPGGSAERPLDVTSASVVEPQASSMPCAACGEQGIRIDDHTALHLDGGRTLRVVAARCPWCGFKRNVYFRIAPQLLS